MYVYIPDSDTFGFINTMLDAIEDHGIKDHINVEGIKRLTDVAQAIATLCRNGCIVVLNEFQYFHRKVLVKFTSLLPVQVAKLKDECFASFRGHVAKFLATNAGKEYRIFGMASMQFLLR